MRALDMWRSKCGGQEVTCLKRAQSQSALAKPSPPLQKVSGLSDLKAELT